MRNDALERKQQFALGFGSPRECLLENCKEELWKYTKWFALAEEFLFRGSERIVNLNIQSLTNGKHWYKIAIEGSLVFEISSKRHALKASKPCNVETVEISREELFSSCRTNR